MSQETNNGEKQLNINLSPETAQGSYSNLAIITHSSSEFILDFAKILPGMPKPEVCSRIIMAPEHVKRLYAALRDNIEKYEDVNGSIKLGGPHGSIPMGGFGPNSAEA